MQSLGVMGDGDTPTAAELNDGLVLLNEMLESWSIDRIMVYQILQENFPLVAGTATYTIGSSGTFNTTRPVRIENAFIRDTNNLDYQLQIVPQQSYDNIMTKTVQSNIPLYMYDDNAYPLSTLKFWPVPSQAYTLYINSWKQLQQFAALSTSVALPPGYQEAIRYSLATRLAPQYGVQTPQEVVALGQSALGRVKRLNSPELYSQTEVAVSSRKKTFNVYRGY
jgi:hypothetical protein